MKSTLATDITIIVLFLSFFAADSLAAPPPWISSRPVSHDYYVGIASCNKQETPDDCRNVAANKALFDLSSAISVDISGEFVDQIVERTGLSEQDVRMEVRAASSARLAGHELVAEWEDRKEYWVYFRLSKEAYHRIVSREREEAVAAAVDMTTRALSAARNGNTISALRFYFEALAKVQNFIGENIQIEIENRATFLFNEIYAGIQNLMTGIRLNAKRDRLPALIGTPFHEPAAVIATQAVAADKALQLSDLPLRFDLPWKSDEALLRVSTDDRGLAPFSLARTAANDNGKTVSARLDVDRLCPEKETRRFFQAMIKKLSIPETAFVIHTYEDKNTFLWHREFEGKDILIASAYQSPESVGRWPKIHDELFNFIKGNGGRPLRFAKDADLKQVLDFSRTSNTIADSDGLPDAEFLIVAVADGKFNKRENAKNPFGEDVQYAGEIRTVVFQGGRPYFSDQYRGATGWNPMGEAMCLDVLALHVFKRWQDRFLQHLQEGAP